ncbi:MAG: hypothetical protein ACLTPN_02435 [Clostridia bacterium]
MNSREKVEYIAKWIVFKTEDKRGALKIGEMLDELLDEINNSIHKDRLKEIIMNCEENIKASKPDDLMFIDYMEDKIRVIQGLIDEIEEKNNE